MARRTTRTVLSTLAAAASLAAIAPAAHAQRIDSYITPALPGFDRNAGVTVLSRLRPLYDDPGIRLGSFFVVPKLDETVGFDSNVNGLNKGPSSPFVQTSPSVSATSSWSRNRLAFTVGADNYHYLDLGNEDYTNVNVGIGGGLTIGRHDLNLGYTHLEQHEHGGDIGSVASSTPVAYSVDVVRSDYTLESGRFSFSPNVDLRRFKFGNAVVQGQTISESFRDRDVYTGGVTTRFELSEQRGLLLVLQGSTSQFSNVQSGSASPNSETVTVLTGIDYQATGPWRYRLLVGGEFRQYQSAVFGNHAAPVIEADVIWTPTGLTTLTGFVRREIEDPQSELTAGYDFTTVSLTADHELKRNVLLQGRATYGAANFLNGGGSASSYSAGGGVNWLVNRRVRLSLDYDFTRQVGTNGSALVSTADQQLLLTSSPTQQLNTLTSGSFSRNVLLFGLHLRL